MGGRGEAEPMWLGYSYYSRRQSHQDNYRYPMESSLGDMIIIDNPCITYYTKHMSHPSRSTYGQP